MIFEVLAHWGPTRETLGPSEEGWAMLDTHRIQALGLKTCVVAKYAFPSVHHHSHFMYMRRLRKEKCYIQVGLARSADPGPDPHPVPQGRVDLALTEVLAQAGALPRGHSPRHGFPTICWAQKWASTEPQPPGLGEWKPSLGSRLPPSPLHPQPALYHRGCWISGRPTRSNHLPDCI